MRIARHNPVDIKLKSGKVSLVYHYFGGGSVYRKNLLHFLEFGCCAEIDVVVVISDSNERLPTLRNVRYVAAENMNYDYGGHALVVNEHLNINDYDYFIFLNCSVRGPFIPNYHDAPWYRAFLDMLDDDVGLAGVTINILSASSPHSRRYEEAYGETGPFAHVQSMFFALKRESLLFLVEQGFFAIDYPMTREEVIRDYEIRLSRMILSGGWNIRSLLSEYNAQDYRGSGVWNINTLAEDGDPSNRAGYFGRSLHPYEAIFIKTNRNIWPEAYLDALSLSMPHRDRSLPVLTRELDKEKIWSLNYKLFSSGTLLGKMKRMIRNSLLYKKVFKVLREPS